MRSCVSMLCLCISLNVFGQQHPPLDFNSIYSYALQEDVKKVLDVLDSMPTEGLTPENRKERERYYERFKSQKGESDYNTDDPMLKSLLKLYHAYWRNVLLDKGNLDRYDAQLRESVVAFLNTQNYQPDSVSQEEVARNFGQHLKSFLAQQRYYSATGKTGSLYDLFIWPSEDTATYLVKLPETEVETSVIFIDSTVTMGWQEYATFGKYYPGGWATKSYLYNVRKAYDTASENFRVSYLTHEAQHFADYESFPKLTGADLEYRAKLTELVFARQTLYKLIRTFIGNASAQGRNAHAFANYAVIRDLSKMIFRQEYVSDVTQWEKVSQRKISKSSERLLKRHSKALKNAGADTVTELIN